MAQSNGMIIFALLVVFFNTVCLEGFAFDRIKRTDDNTIRNRIPIMGNLVFDQAVVPLATEHRKIACLFVFDKEASAELNNNIDLANLYATQLAFLASQYMAHANIAVTNAGVELWAGQDRIPFTSAKKDYTAMPDYVTQFQAYLNGNKASAFGTTYAIGVLLSNKTTVQGGYSQGPPCSTSGVSLINFLPIPWSIGGLIAHELAHTLSVVHPFELSYLCPSFPALEFCRNPNSIPDECTCASSAFPPQQCLMTYQFGRANVTAPRYTKCDIQMMNYFSSNIPCLIK